MKPLIEICIEGAESAVLAEKGGAKRVELCSDLFEGGITPSIGTVRAAKKLSSIALNVMVRPRGGDFCYSDIEFEAMKEDIKALKDEGVYGVVFGILTPDGSVDKERCAELVKLARPLACTFHRAFDMVKDQAKALEDIISLGFDRILTSGGEPSALEGAEKLQKIMEQAGDRIIIMPGAGIKDTNIERINRLLHAKEYHMSRSSEVRTKMEYHPGNIFMGGTLRQSEFALKYTDSDKVKAILELSEKF